MAKRRRHPRYENVEITGIAAEGKAIARIENLVVFVPGVVPGDVVDIQVNKKKKSYREGYVLKFHKYSKDRCKAFCNHFGVCGGCKWQILPYKQQLEYKQQEVIDNFTRIGKFEIPSISPILQSGNTSLYRNKLEFTFSNKRWLTEDDMNGTDVVPEMNALGFHVPGRYDKIVDVEHCHLQRSPSNEIRNEIRDYALKNNVSFFDIREQTGFLRTLIIRTSSIGDVMVIVTFYQEDEQKREALLEHLKNKFPEISSLMYVINTKGNDSITDQEVICYSGKDYIIEKMEGIQFKIGPKSFYQTNSEQAYELYKVTRDFAGLTGSETVYDLYTGTGTIANFIAKDTKQVVGVEYVPEAIEDARLNSHLNGIENTKFYSGDMKDVFSKEFIDSNGKPDVLIVDPPRAGVHPKVIDAILYCDSPIIVYVSCNPATQARDIAMLSHAYDVEKVQPVDMFPHTHHVENVVKLVKKKLPA